MHTVLELLLLFSEVPAERLGHAPASVQKFLNPGPSAISKPQASNIFPGGPDETQTALVTL